MKPGTRFTGVAGLNSCSSPADADRPTHGWSAAGTCSKDCHTAPWKPKQTHTKSLFRALSTTVGDKAEASPHFQHHAIGDRVDDSHPAQELTHTNEVIPFDRHQSLPVRSDPEFAGGFKDCFRLFPLGFLREGGDLRLGGPDGQFRVAQYPVLRLEDSPP